jgi:hypothetical protein
MVAPVGLAAADLGLVPFERFGKRPALRLWTEYEDAVVHLGLGTACPGLGLCLRVERLVLWRVGAPKIRSC